MKYEKIGAYDRLKDKTIDICLNCTKKECKGDCRFKSMKNKIKTKV